MLFTTEIKAIDPRTGELKTYAGEHIEAPSFLIAQLWCMQNKGYLKVKGLLIQDGEIDYYPSQNN